MTQAAEAIFETSVASAKGLSYLAEKASNAYKTKSFGSDVRFEPLNSDLAYLLHDKDEIGISTNTYIVNNLSEYGVKCIPLKVYVSALLRTWETAVLLYLPFLYNNENPEYSQTLILEVSPFLLESVSKNISKEATLKSKTKSNIKDIFWNSNSNKPLDFKGNVEQFCNFIKLFIYFKKESIKNKLSFKVRDILSKIPKKFTIILTAGNDKVCLRISITDGTTEIIDYYSSNATISSAISSSANSNINIPDKNLKNINQRIVDKINLPDSSDKYESYSENRLNDSNPAPQTIYTTFSIPDVSYFNSFENIGKFTPDIFSFLKWVIEIKSHPKNMPILFVSHSNTMREFLSLMIANLNYNYQFKPDNMTKGNDFSPSQEFINVFTIKNLQKTNTWSMRFKYLGYNVTGFRHAQSCDNIYETLGILKTYSREKSGNYTNISLWGIFSTLIFIHMNKDKISNFNDITEMAKSGLLVLKGMPKQTKDDIKEFGLDNEITCGDISKRFLFSADANPNALNFTFKPIEQKNFVDIIPYSLPLRDISVTDRQRMSYNLFSLDNIFNIIFQGCDSNGCNLSVMYIGNYNFGDVLTTNINALQKRSVKISIKVLNHDNGEYQLTLLNVNPGGLVVDKSGTQVVKNKFKQLFKKEDIEKPVNFKNTNTNTSGESDLVQEQKIELSDDFQNSVSFLLGFDIIQAEALTYDILYNTLIFYSNLLIRQMITIYLILSVSNITANPTISRVNDFLSTKVKSTELYGGKNNQDNNEDNNEKKMKNLVKKVKRIRKNK